MPASPACSARMKSQQLRCARRPSRRCGSGCSAGRSSRRTRARRRAASRSTISARVCGSAVAVSAMRGTPGKRSCSTDELQVFRAEVVAPLRHAVRLVDREQRESACARAASRQRGVSRRSGATYSRSSSPARSARSTARASRRVQRRVEERRAHAELRAAPPPGPASARSAARPRSPAPSRSSAGNLVAQRLAAAGRHQHQRVAAAGDVRDDRRLLRRGTPGSRRPPAGRQAGRGWRARNP